MVREFEGNMSIARVYSRLTLWLQTAAILGVSASYSLTCSIPLPNISPLHGDFKKLHGTVPLWFPQMSLCSDIGSLLPVCVTPARGPLRDHLRDICPSVSTSGVRIEWRLRKRDSQTSLGS